MPAPEASSNLRELLRVREEDSNGGEDEHRRNAVAKLTLAAVLGNEKRQGDAQMSRTLLDIIRDESAATGSSPYADGHFNRNSKTSWKSFKDRLRLRRAGAAWTSSVHIPTSDVPMRANSRGRNARQHSNSRLETAVDEADADSSSSSQERGPPPTAAGGRGQMSRMSSTRMGSTRFTRVTFNLEDESNQNESDESPSPPRGNRDGSSSPSEVIVEEEGEEADPGEAEGGEPPVRMSLMALLEETDRQAGVVGPTYASSVYDEDDEDDDDEEDENEGGDGHNRQEFNCCVCMVRHKGAAFIPCGHTFCRLCSRELWVSRGNCPICNGFILEILDIF